MKKFATLLVCLYCLCSCSDAQVSPNKLPVDGSRWYQMNNTTTSLQGLFDGNLSTKLITGYGLILSRYESWYRLLDGEQMTIDSIRMYDGQGTFTTTPMYLYSVNDRYERTLIATFTGEQYNTWVGPDPANPKQFALSAPATGFRYLVISSTSSSFPAEIEFLGSYTPPSAARQAVQPRHLKLGGEFGVNAFEWNFEDPTKPLVIDEARMAAVKTFTGVRHYLDWKRLEATEGSYTFNPSHTGSFNYDAIYDRCQKEGIEVLACLKTIPTWMLATYPDSLKDEENVPVRYGKDYADPLSYIEQARLGFQFAARYGANKNVDAKLVTVNTATRWTNDPANQVKIGLGTIRYIECENERDKSWKGRKAYQTGREYAANLSAFYDGHKNSMGPGVGVKNADPSMKVVMAGLAGAKIDYLMGMIDWCREFRGYKPDGSVDLCWDVINYHYYSNDGQQSQSGTSTRGSAPEATPMAKVAADFVATAQQYAQDMPVWITETGYDLNQGSPYKAIPIGDKTALQTQADWILRTALLAARNGIEKVFFYQMYDNNPTSSGKFNSMGLINSDKSRRPAADYLYQANKLMGQYAYQETLHADPVVDRYELNGNSAWVLVVPDEKGRTATYSLNTGTATVRVFKPTIGSDSMTEEVLNTVNGSIDLTVTETPLFVLPGESNAAANVPAGAGALAGPATVCLNASAEYTVPPVADATGYEWTVPAGWIIKAGANSNTISVVAGGTDGAVNVRPFNAAGFGAGSTLSVTSETVPVLNPLSGPTEACENSLTGYNTGSDNASSYAWSVTGSGWNIDGSNNSNTVKILVGHGTGSISVTGSNACGSSTAIVLAVKSNPVVVSVGIISGNGTACEGTTQSFNISSVSNASSYAWSVPDGWNIASGQGTTLVNVVVGSNSGRVEVKAANACGNATATKDIAITAGSVQISNNAGASAARNLSSGCTYSVAGDEFDATATSNCGGVPATQWQLTGATTGSGSGSLAGVAFNAGNTTIIWKTAATGNTVSCQTIVSVKDAMAPVINPPANVSQSVSGNKCSSPLLIPNPTINENCTLVVVTWVMSGATTASSAATGINYVGKQNFNVGTTYITYTAKDAAGNQSSAQFTVTLNNPRCSGSNTVRSNKRMETSLLALQAYPNPSDKYFNIRISGSEDLTVDVRVIDMLGRVVELRKSVKAGTVVQFGQNYRPGWYILEAIQGEERKQVKLVKGPQNL